MLLEGKIIGITGGGSGIGKATALALASEGAILAVTSLNEVRAMTVSDEINKAGGKSSGWAMDVTDKSRVETILTQVIEKFGRLDVWINNAGVSSLNRFIDLTEKDWDYNMNVNAKGTFICSQVVTRQLLIQAADPITGIRGKIINVASLAGIRGDAPLFSHYVASKFAVVGFTQAIACELASQGIIVNAVCPGYIRTNMLEREAHWEAELRGITVEEVVKPFIPDTSLGRLGTPDDIAKVIIFLASSHSDFITGASLNVTGGYYIG